MRRTRHLAACVLLASLAPAAGTAAADAAFSGWRHADTSDTDGPYTVSVRQVAGARVERGVLHWVAERNGRSDSGESPTEPPSSDGDIAGRVPSQPAGTTVRYWFTWRVDGDIVRHPARSPGAYVFRIVPFEVLEVHAPDVAAVRPRARVVVRGAARPEGEFHANVLPPGSAAQATTRALSPCEETRPRTHCLEAELPDVPRGALVDWSFRLRTGDGAALTVPDGGAFVATATAADVLPVVGGAQVVLALASRGPLAWIGWLGAGVWEAQQGEIGHFRSVADGLPSGVVRFLADDPASRVLYVGTDAGVVALGDGRPAVRVDVPDDPLAKSPCASYPCRGGPGVVSPLDGTLLVQLEPAPEAANVGATPVFLEGREGRFRRWQPKPVGGRIAGLFSASFDPVDGCFLLGAAREEADGGVRPVVLRRCSDEPEATIVHVVAGSGEGRPQRIAGVERDPAGGLVAAVEWKSARGGASRYGLVHIGEGEPRAVTVGAEVTALRADWARRRVLVGTYGGGVLEYRDGRVTPLDIPGLPREVTALQVTPDDRLRVGTAHGAFDATLIEPRAARVGPAPEETLPGDALPMDVHPRSGRVLLSSASLGLLELERGGGAWRQAVRWCAGTELPPGVYGDAQYGRGDDSGAIAALNGRDAIAVRGSRAAPLLADQPQRLSDRLPLRLLARSAGGFGIAFTPLPLGEDSGGGVVLVRKGRVTRTVPIRDRALATIGRWVEVPERRSIFAATPAGVLEIDETGALRLRSNRPASSIARDPRRGTIAASGSAIERWDGERFLPVLFRLGLPGRAEAPGLTGDPIDVAIDPSGCWYLLYARGLLAVLDAAGNARGTLGTGDGIPPTARRLLAAGDDILVGSTREGLAVVRGACGR